MFVVYDVLGELFDSPAELSAEAGPLTVTQSRTAVNEVDLPVQLEQPSGVHINEKAIYLSTDQAELFVLNYDGTLALEQSLVSGPLLFKQGSIESVSTFGNELLVIGELGEIRVWQIDGSKVTASDPKPLGSPYDDMEFQGLTMFGGSLLAVDEDSHHLHNLTTGKSFVIDFSAVLKEGMSAADISFSGIAADLGRLYIITKNFTSILVVNPRGWLVEQVVDIDDVQASDIAIHEGLVFVTVDHNFFDERSPILVYDKIALPPVF